MDEFVIVKYIEISISTKIVYANFDRRSLSATISKEYHKEHVHTFILSVVTTKS